MTNDLSTPLKPLTDAEIEDLQILCWHDFDWLGRCLEQNGRCASFIISDWTPCENYSYDKICDSAEDAPCASPFYGMEQQLASLTRSQFFILDHIGRVGTLSPLPECDESPCLRVSFGSRIWEFYPGGRKHSVMLPANWIR